MADVLKTDLFLTQLAMIVSGDHVLFLSPSERNLSFCGKHSLLLSLQNVKR